MLPLWNSRVEQTTAVSILHRLLRWDSVDHLAGRSEPEANVPLPVRD
jgi:hypothetical protein